MVPVSAQKERCIQLDSSAASYTIRGEGAFMWYSPNRATPITATFVASALGALLPFWTPLATSSSLLRMNACLNSLLASANACMRASTWNCKEPEAARGYKNEPCKMWCARPSATTRKRVRIESTI